LIENTRGRGAGTSLLSTLGDYAVPIRACERFFRRGPPEMARRGSRNFMGCSLNPRGRPPLPSSRDLSRDHASHCAVPRPGIYVLQPNRAFRGQQTRPGVSFFLCLSFLPPYPPSPSRPILFSYPEEVFFSAEGAFSPVIIESLRTYTIRRIFTSVCPSPDATAPL